MGKADTPDPDAPDAREPDAAPPSPAVSPRSGAPARPVAPPDEGAPVGRRVVLGMLGLGAVGVFAGSRAQNAVGSALAPISNTVSDIVPATGGFRFYSVAGSVDPRPAPDYRLRVDGLVEEPDTFSMAQLQAMPRTRLVRDFQCVTGWRVSKVPWTGVALPDLLDHVGVKPGAKAVRFHSFDLIYTESLTLEQASRRDVLVAYGMRDSAVIHDHGGPVRLYVAPMYGYKSLKWLSRIEVVDRVKPGYWEKLGYDDNAWVGRSNGRTDVAT